MFSVRFEFTSGTFVDSDIISKLSNTFCYTSYIVYETTSSVLYDTKSKRRFIPKGISLCIIQTTKESKSTSKLVKFFMSVNNSKV